MKEKSSNQKIIHNIACLGIVLMVCLIPVLLNSRYLKEPPLQTEYTLDYPFYAITDEQSNIYAIDKSRQRIVKIRKDGTFVFDITGGKRKEKNFYRADDLAVDQQGNIYVTDVIAASDGSAITKERILKYDSDGNFSCVLFEAEYPIEDRPLTNGRVQALTYKESGLEFIYSGKDGFSLKRIEPGAHEETTVRQIPYDTESLLSYGISKTAEHIYCVTKHADMIRVEPDGAITVIYRGDQHNRDGFFSIPWKVTVDHHETVYFTDIGLRCITSMDQTGNLQTVLQREDAKQLKNNPIYYNVQISDSGWITTTNLNGIVILEDGGKTVYGSKNQPIQCSAHYLLRRGMVYLLCMVSFIMIIFIVRLAAKLKIRITVTEMAKNNMIIALVAIIISGFVFSMVMDNMQRRYINQVMYHMSGTAGMLGRILDSHDIEQINTPQDYTSDSYQRVKAAIQKEFSGEAQWIQGLYCVLNKVDENQIIYSCLYLEDTIGSVYPLDWDYEGSEYETVYETGRQVAFDWIENADGIWFYVLSPVFNDDGKVIAALEVGTNLSAFREENHILMRDMVRNVVSIVAMIILLFSEYFCFSFYREKQKAEHAKKEPAFSGFEVYLVRPIIFLVFMADCMATAFLPMHSKNLAVPLLGIPAEFMSVVPISTEVFMTAVFSFAGGYWIEKTGLRRLLIMGAFLLTGGLVSAGFSASMLPFMGAKTLTGMGMGLILVGINTLLASCTGEKKKLGFSLYHSGSLAGLTVGTTAGSFLAGSLGYSRVYFVAALLSAAVLIMMLLFLQKDKDLPKGPAVIKQERRSRTMAALLSDKRVASFFAGAMMPYLICGYFLSYFMPMFAQSQGMTESWIGQLFLINGLCVIYLSPPLTGYLLGRIKTSQAVLAAGGLYILSFVMFFVWPGTIMAVMTALLFGIADSFGFSALSLCYLNLEAVTCCDSGKSMGLYSTFENIAQTAGPFVFSYVLMIGAGKGSLVIAAIYGFLLAGYFFFQNHYNDYTQTDA